MKQACWKVVIKEDESAYLDLVPSDDPEALSWREAKKRLRAFYLDKIKKLRSLTEYEMRCRIFDAGNN